MRACVRVSCDRCHECRVVDLAAADGSFAGQLAGCDAVIHLAALAKPWEPYDRIHANNMIVDQALRPLQPAPWHGLPWRWNAWDAVTRVPPEHVEYT